jgi:DnaJ-class molecular chaperone
MPIKSSSYKGNHYVKIVFDTPKKLSAKEQELYEGLAKEAKLNAKTKKGDKGFFSSLFS